MQRMNDSCWNKTRSCEDDALVRNTKLRTIVFGEFEQNNNKFLFGNVKEQF